MTTLSKMSAELRAKLGESLPSVQRFGTPIVEATTPSLEALKAYSLGRKTFNAKGAMAALAFFNRAVELDPKFAMAYAGVGTMHQNLHEVAVAGENLRKAYDLREKVSERERLIIESLYNLFATGELEKAAQVFRVWQQTYPQDQLPYNNLGLIYDNLGSYEKALEELREAQRLEPNAAIIYVNMAYSYACLNRLKEAEAVFKQAEERKLEHELLSLNRYLVAFSKGNTAEMRRLQSEAEGRPGMEQTMLSAAAEALVKKVVFDEVQCCPHEFNNAERHVCET